MGKVQKLLNEKIIKSTEISDSQNKADTIRLWESYRDHALLWRAIALLQIPVTILVILLCFLMWSTRTVRVMVPRDVKPGMFAIRDVPDAEFLDYATDYINLVASYQPAIARRQFVAAREMLTEPVLSAFDRDMLNGELKTIETTGRTQIFYINPAKTKIERNDTAVNVEFEGDRLKIVAGQELPTVASTYKLTMKVLPRNKFNPFGIVVTNVEFKNVE